MHPEHISSPVSSDQTTVGTQVKGTRVCVCVCVRKVNIVFHVCLTPLCARRPSDLPTLPVYLARLPAV